MHKHWTPQEKEKKGKGNANKSSVSAFFSLSGLASFSAVPNKTRKGGGEIGDIFRRVLAPFKLEAKSGAKLFGFSFPFGICLGKQNLNNMKWI